MSSVALENMLIWTKKLENSYIRLRQNYTDLPKIAPKLCVSEGRGNRDENDSCVSSVSFWWRTQEDSVVVYVKLIRHSTDTATSMAWRLQAIRFTSLRPEGTDRGRRNEVTAVYSLHVASRHRYIPQPLLGTLSWAISISTVESRGMIHKGGGEEEEKKKKRKKKKPGIYLMRTSLNFTTGTLQCSKASRSHQIHYVKHSVLRITKDQIQSTQLICTTINLF